MDSKKLVSAGGKKLLLVEGKDEENFFKALFEKKNIKAIQIIKCGGKDQFKDKIKAITKLPNFDEAESLAVMQDADRSADAAFESVCSILKKNGLPFPKKPETFSPGPAKAGFPKAGVFIVPGGGKSGSLETLLLSTVEPKSLLECVDSFMDCAKKASESNGYKPPKNMDKARCRAFLSSMERDTPSLGVAAQKGCWNLQSDKLQPVLRFLKEL